MESVALSRDGRERGRKKEGRKREVTRDKSPKEVTEREMKLMDLTSQWQTC